MKNLKLILLPSFLLLSIISLSQDRTISNTIKNMNDGKFEEAQSRIYRLTTKQTESFSIKYSQYIFFANKLNPKYNPDSAFDCLNIAQELLQIQDQDQIDRYCKIMQICSDNLLDQKKKLALESIIYAAKFSSTKKLLEYNKKYKSYQFIEEVNFILDSLLFIQAEKENNIISYNNYIKLTPGFKYKQLGIEKLHEIEYLNALSFETSDSLFVFINRYPNAKQVSHAKNEIYKREYERVKLVNNDLGFSKYLNDYKDSPYANDIKNIYLDRAVLIPYLKGNGKYIYVDSISMFPMIDREFDGAYFFQGNIAFVQKDDLYGIINRKGVDIIPFSYTNKFLSIREDLTVLINTNEFSIIDNNTSNVILSIKLVDEAKTHLNYERINIEPFINGQYAIKIPTKEDSVYKIGIWDKNKGWIIPYDNNKYNDYVLINKYIFLKKDNLWFEYNYEQIERSYPFAFTNMDQNDSDLIKICKDNKWGVINKDYQIVVPIQYSEIEIDFRQYYKNRFPKNSKKYYENIITQDENLETHLFIFYKVDNKWGVINRNGKIILKPTFKSIEGFNQNGYSIVSKNYDDVTFIDNGTKIVTESSIYGVIDTSGNTIINCIYNSLRELLDGNISYYKYGKYNPNELYTLNVINSKNKYRKYKMIFGTIDTKGNEFINSKYQIEQMGDDLLLFVRDINTQKSGIIDFKGKIIFENKYDDIERVYTDDFGYKNYFKIRNGPDLYGLIDITGKVIVPPIYQSVSISENNKYIIVGKESKYGLIDITGKVIVPPIYQSVSISENNKYIIVGKESKFGVYNISGKLIIPTKYDKIYYLSDDLFKVKFGFFFGVLNESNYELLPLIYDQIIQLNNLFETKVNNKYKVFDHHFDPIIDGDYDKILYPFDHYNREIDYEGNVKFFIEKPIDISKIKFINGRIVKNVGQKNDNKFPYLDSSRILYTNSKLEVQLISYESYYLGLDKRAYKD